MKMIVWVLIFIMGLLSVLVNLMKKWVMNWYHSVYGEITISKAMQMQTWILLMKNPFAILILFIGFLGYLLGMWIFSMEEVSKLVLISYAMGIPFLLLNVFLGMLIFGDSLTHSQWIGIGIIVVAGIIAIPGMYLVGQGVS